MIRAVLYFCAYVMTNTQFTLASMQWNIFTTSKYYANIRMVIDPSYSFSIRYMPKERISGKKAQLDCAFACTGNRSCLAFNFYEGETFYVCELLPDNFCADKLQKTLMRKNGSSVWDKTSAGTKTSCFEIKFSSNLGTIPCRTLQPGCTGTWPNCTYCDRSCIDCNKRLLSSCTIWPDAIAPHLSPPVSVKCYKAGTYLTYRTVNLVTGKVERDDQLSFEDMQRLHKLNIYSVLTFWFGITGGDWYYASYQYSYIDSEGTLFNMTFAAYKSPTLAYKSAGDIFKLNGKALGSVPFSRVANDIYGCGSFWVLDVNNATFCPGGNIRMWGTPKLNAGFVKSSGISVPVAPAIIVLKEACIELTNTFP